MTIRGYVCASLALVAWLPAVSRAAVVQATVSAPTSPAAGSTVQIVCYAEGRNPGGMTGGETMQYVDVTVSGGTVSPARIPGPAVQSTTCVSGLASCNVIQGSASWATPTGAATLTATCAATYLGGFTGSTTSTAAGSATLTTVAGGPLPPVVSAVAGPGQLVVGSAAGFSVTATDPNVPPKPLTYVWSASGGSLTVDPSNPAAVTWQAPAAAGAYELKATVSNGAASSVSTSAVAVVLAAYQGALPVPVGAPRRLCESDTGGLFVVDGDPGAMGRVALLDPAGAVRGFASLPERALAVAYGAGFLWVTTADGGLFKVDTRSGQTVGKVTLAGGALRGPSGIAFDSANLALWVAETDAGRVRVIRPDGATVAVLDAAGGAPVAAPLDVAIDATGGRAWVLAGTAKSALSPGDPAAAGLFVHTFDLASRRYVASFAQSGSAAGQLTRVGGLTVAGGKVYVSDIFQGTVQVFGKDGSPLGTVGAFGQTQGQLMNPMGLTSMANGDLVVANASLGRVERFGSGAALPSCTGAACLANADWRPLGKAPFASGPLRKGPKAKGKGGSSGAAGAGGAGVAGKQVPPGVNVARPTVVASGPSRRPPGLVKLLAVATGGACAFQWSQVGGPPVRLGSATTASPSFVARAAGTYSFDAVATCGAASARGRVAVAIENRPPLADAGRVMVVRPGAPFRLDAAFSSDANGDPLSFSWDQTLGRPVAGHEDGAALVARPERAGLYAFQVTVTDGRGGESVAEVPILVAPSQAPAATAVAVARPAEARAGETVLLDASESRGGAFTWRQVAGPAARLVGESEPVASFAPPSAGKYRFEVSVARGGLLSPPAQVDVFVAEAGGAVPAVTASTPEPVVAVNQAVPLEARGTGSALHYGWRQVSGPAAGLWPKSAPSATAVPFAPGYYVFEVTVRDGAAEGRPARVAFEARAGGLPIPRARAVTPRVNAWVGELVFLDGRASTGTARFRWTQVAGPWITLGAQEAVTWFRPLEPGTYAFELEVDDGTTRSAPNRVQVEVTEGGK